MTGSVKCPNMDMIWHWSARFHVHVMTLNGMKGLWTYVNLWSCHHAQEQRYNRWDAKHDHWAVRRFWWGETAWTTHISKACVRQSRRCLGTLWVLRTNPGPQTMCMMRLSYHQLLSAWVNQRANKVLWMKDE